MLTPPEVRLSPRVGAPAASEDPYDPGRKPDQDANLPSVVIGSGHRIR
jgi:hypothetical protein